MLDWFKKLLSPPVFEDDWQTLVVSVLNTVLWVFLVLTLVSLPLYVGLYRVEAHTPDGLALLILGVFLAFTFAFLLRLVRRGRVRLTASLFLLLLWGVVTQRGWLNAGITNSRISYVYPLIVVFSALLLGSRAAVMFAALSIIGILGAYSAERAGRSVPLYEAVEPLDLTVMIGVLTILTLVLVYGRRNLARTMADAQRSALAQERASRQLKTMQAGMEERIRQRTRALENRADLLRGVVDVGRLAVSMQAPDELMALVAQGIADHFGFTHVGIYMLDVASNQAILRAVGGEFGVGVPAIGHELSAANESVVGECLRFWRPRIAFSARLPRTAFAVGETLLSVHHVSLSGTDVEVVLPLMVGGRPLGALDMHIDDAGRFQLEDLEAWQIVADQVAIAVENARRFAQSQSALEAERDSVRRSSREGWMKLLLAQETAGYRYKNQRVDPIDDTWPAEMDEVLATDARLVKAESIGEEGGSVVAVPVRVRDNTIGVLHLRKHPGAGAWTNRELDLLATLTDQLETALESARLYRETRLAAAHQRALAEVGAGIREEIEIETVLSRALKELGTVLAAESGTVLFSLNEPQEDAV